MKIINRITISILMCLASLGVCQAREVLATADSAYNAGKYADAISLYQGKMEMHGTSAEALYNLGNAYYQVGDLGNARLCYERARRLDPSAREINNNLNYVCSKVEDANRADLTDKKVSVNPVELSFFQSLHRMLVLDRAVNFWSVLGIVSFILLLVCVACYLFSRNVALRKVGFFGGALLILVTLCSIGLGFSSARAMERHDDGVVMAFKASLLEEPSSSAKTATSPLHRGTKLQILAEETGPSGEASWYKVRLNNDFVGWISARDFEVI